MGSGVYIANCSRDTAWSSIVDVSRFSALILLCVPCSLQCGRSTECTRVTSPVIAHFCSTLVAITLLTLASPLSEPATPVPTQTIFPRSICELALFFNIINQHTFATHLRSAHPLEETQRRFVVPYKRTFATKLLSVSARCLGA